MDALARLRDLTLIAQDPKFYRQETREPEQLTRRIRDMYAALVWPVTLIS